MKKLLKKMVGLTTVMMLLNACHHENPLKTQTIKISTKFLVNASANVEKRLEFPIHKDAFGFAYLECMEGKKSTEIRCRDLYQGMIAFAHEGHYPTLQN